MSASFLLLTQTMIGNFAVDEWPKYGVPAFYPFKKVNKLLRAIRRLWMILHLPFDSLWYSKGWVEYVKKSDVIVVHMSRLTMRLPRYINSINSKAKVVAWYWNVVNETTLPQKVKGTCEFWTFDSGDSEKYNMHLNHQYYFKTLVKESCGEDIDVFFCGTDSGRGKRIVELHNSLEEMGLKTVFKIVFPKYDQIPNGLKSSPVDYSVLLDYNMRSKALLEITRDGQVGATARLMEALFLKKKFITNNESAMNEPFYCHDNIFILGKRDLKELPQFISSGYDHSADVFVEKYDFSSWLQNFTAR